MSRTFIVNIHGSGYDEVDFVEHQGTPRELAERIARGMYREKIEDAAFHNDMVDRGEFLGLQDNIGRDIHVGYQHLPDFHDMQIEIRNETDEYNDKPVFCAKFMDLLGDVDIEASYNECRRKRKVQGDEIQKILSDYGHV